MNKKLLIIDDDEAFIESLEKILSLDGFDVTKSLNPLKAIDLVKQNHFDCVLTDVKMPGMNGIELQKKIAKINSLLPIIAISGQSNISNAVDMLKNGAYDFLEKPVDDERLIAVINNAIAKQTLTEENKNILCELKDNFQMVGKSKQFNKIIDNINLIAPTDARVLITGNTGTGKELVAWAIHHNSNRKNKPYLKLNCASIPKELLESELFGHKKGSFTGAEQNRIGKFVAANRGTLFLDEIGEMDFTLQAKLLRVLEEGEVDVIGENKPRKIDVRIIVATNKNLKEKIMDGSFREDLFYRINVFEIYVPTLEERHSDILPISYHFLKKYSEIYNKKISHFSSQLEGILTNNKWNGNIRELKNTIEKLVILASNNEITVQDYYNSDCNKDSNFNHKNINSLKSAKEHFEKELIIEMLIKHNWKVPLAAEELKIERTNLFKKMQKYSIKRN